MKRMLLRCARSQDGFTLVELIITSVLTLIVMTGLTSVVLTTMRGNDIATDRIEASSQIRNFELRAYDDFAGSVVPNPATCTPPPAACSIVLGGTPVSNSSTPTIGPYQPAYVTYNWNGTAGTPLDRTVGPFSSHLANDVSFFSWHLAGRSVVVTLTVTVRSYSETQTLLFYPRVG